MRTREQTAPLIADKHVETRPRRVPAKPTHIIDQVEINEDDVQVSSRVDSRLLTSYPSLSTVKIGQNVPRDVLPLCHAEKKL